LEPRVVVGVATRDPDPYLASVGVTLASVQARNPVAMALGTKPQFASVMWRQVAPVRGGGPAYRAVSLLATADRDRFTWLEDHFLESAELQRAVGDLSRNPSARAAKQLSDDPRPVGVAVSEPQPGKEGDAGRVVVVGNGLFVSDAAAMQREPPGFALVSGSVDWLRERPQLGIAVENKKYVEFKFPATTDENRGLFLPLLLSVTLVAGLGVGVWMVRRGSA
jgi:hypothetical protein